MVSFHIVDHDYVSGVQDRSDSQLEIAEFTFILCGHHHGSRSGSTMLLVGLTTQYIMMNRPHLK